MAKYNYKLVDGGNRIIEGTVNAITAKKARAAVGANGSTVLALTRASGLWNKELSLPSMGFAAQDKILFFRNLATMLSAGLSVSESLRVLEEQARSASVKNAIKSMVANVENGQKLSTAMAAYPKFFSEYISETVNVGEVTGKMSDVLDRISTDLESDLELSRRVRGAMAYPAVIIVVMIAAIILLVTLVLPKIADIFREMNVELPLTTRMLMGFGSFVNSHYISLSMLFFAALAGLYMVWSNPRGKKSIQLVLLKTPVFGELVKEFNLARFFRGLESLYASGISLVRSVDIASKTLKNSIYKDALATAHPILMRGAPLSDVLKQFPRLFPLQARKMVQVGEQTGKLEEIFMRVTRYFEKTLRHKTRMLSVMIEPMLMLMVGIVVGGLALSIFTPIYQIGNAF